MRGQTTKTNLKKFILAVMKINIMRDTWAIKSIDSNWVKNVHRYKLLSIWVSQKVRTDRSRVSDIPLHEQILEWSFTRYLVHSNWEYISKVNFQILKILHMPPDTLWYNLVSCSQQTINQFNFKFLPKNSNVFALIQPSALFEII